MTKTTEISKEKVWELLEEVNDPEVPVLTVIDLGIVRDVIYDTANDTWEIQITPTYSGCPAMDMIRTTIKMTLLSHGLKNVVVKQILSPAWTTEWMSAAGKKKLKEYGIAPPNPKQQVCNDKLFSTEAVQCPHCESWRTHRVSEFGSTACKALYVCDECREPFDYFKCH